MSRDPPRVPGGRRHSASRVRSRVIALPFSIPRPGIRGPTSPSGRTSATPRSKHSGTRPRSAAKPERSRGQAGDRFIQLGTSVIPSEQGQSPGSGTKVKMNCQAASRLGATSYRASTSTSASKLTVAVVDPGIVRVHHAGVQGLIEHVKRQVGAKQVLHPPAYDALGEGVDDERDVEEPRPSRDLRDVCEPLQGVQSRGLEYPDEPVCRAREHRRRHHRLYPPALRYGTKTNPYCGCACYRSCRASERLKRPHSAGYSSASQTMVQLTGERLAVRGDLVV